MRHFALIYPTNCVEEEITCEKFFVASGDAFRVTGVRLQFAPDITEIHYSMFVWDALFLIKYGGV
jgi:hypothetical protein